MQLYLGLRSHHTYSSIHTTFQTPQNTGTHKKSLADLKMHHKNDKNNHNHGTWCQFITSLHFNKFSKHWHPLMWLRLSSQVYIPNSFLMLIITDPANPPPTANSSVLLTSQHLIKKTPQQPKFFWFQNDWFSHSNISPPHGHDIKLWQVWGSCSDDDRSKNVIQLWWQKVRFM